MGVCAQMIDANFKLEEDRANWTEREEKLVSQVTIPHPSISCARFSFSFLHDFLSHYCPFSLR